MTSTQARAGSDASTQAALREVEQRVLWLATAIVHHANRVRSDPSGLKVGGHQASSASMVTIMTALWFEHLRAEDRVSVKPHASPVLHAINYLLGELDERYLTTLRAFGGLQSYPSRSKDPDPVDYSTGSVGIGATAPIWGALARRYVGSLPRGPAGSAGSAVTAGSVGTAEAPGRQYSLLGDAELDEGACWEAILDPMVGELGEVVWIVDLNRQSLDRVMPIIGATRLQGMFEAAGWQVLTVKYGRLLEELFTRPGGAALRTRIDEMSNPEYQRLLRCTPAQLRERLPADTPAAEADPATPPAPANPVASQQGGLTAVRPQQGHLAAAVDHAANHDIAALIADLDDDTLHTAIRNLGGHDLAALGDALRAIDDTRPTVIFAYTVKGYGLASEGHPQNHSSLLTAEQLATLAARVGVDVDRPWAPFPADSPSGELCAATAARLRRDPVAQVAVPALPVDIGRTPHGTATTQAALGRALLDLTREAPEAARRVVTLCPDVSSSTNLGGWVNKVGVWSARERVDWFADDPETILHWREQPTGQHLELGIAETNLVGLLGEFGATWSRWGQPLLPIGVLYDPFVERALEPWSFGMYAGGQSILVGTPSGVTLAPEGGAHQSISTPSVGLEQPGCIAYEPAFAIDVEWTLLASLARLGRPDGTSAYLRLSTRPVDQTLAAVPDDPAARERRRRQVVAGAYLLRRAGADGPEAGATGSVSARASGAPAVTIAAMGAVVPEALAAAERLARLGRPADVVCVTSPGLVFDAMQSRAGRGTGESWVLDATFPARRAAPLVTVLDGHPHALAFLAGINQVRAAHLGVTRFGQSGDLAEVYRYHGLDADSIVAAALDLVD